MYAIITNIKDTIWDYRKKSFASLASYFLRGIRIFFYFNGHLKLSKVLRPLHASGLVSAKISHIYLFKYLSDSLSTITKLRILTNHYTYFQNKFPRYVVNQIFREGITCWTDVQSSNIFEIRLVSTTPFENEGSLSLIFNMNGNTIYRVAFTFSPGNQFGIVDEQIIYITRIQGVKGSLDDISTASKFFSENIPPSLLISAMEGISVALGIKTIIGISSKNQISFNKNDHNFFKNYDDFWETFESVKISDGDYLLNIPLQHKTISLIKSKHRNRTINKRKIRQEVSRKIYIYFTGKLSGTRKLNNPFHHLSVVKQVPKAAAC